MRHAFQAIGESATATRRLLAGASVMTWGRLAALAAFVGALTPPLILDLNRGSRALETVRDLLAAPSATVATASALLVVLALAWLSLGTVFEFVFLEALRGEAVRLRSAGKRWWHVGLRVVAFRLVALGLAAGGVIAGSPWPAPALAPLAIVGGACLAIDRATVTFVVPIVFVDGRSPTAGWRTFLRTLRVNPGEYAGYAVVAGVLWCIVAVGGGLLVALFAFALAVPFSAFGAVVVALLVEQGLPMAVVGRAAVATLAVPYLAVFLGTVLLVRVPLIVYLRYLALFVLGDIDERYDLIPRTRAMARWRRRRTRHPE